MIAWYDKEKGIDLPILREILFGSIFLIFFYYALFDYPFAFNFELTIHGHYFMVMVAIFGLFLFGVLSFFDRALLNADHLIMALIAGCTLIFPAARGNEYLMNMSCIIISFLLLRSLDIRTLKVLLEAVGAAVCCQIVLGLAAMKQMPDDTRSEIIGTLHNTGVLAMFLVIGLPILFYMCFYGVEQSALKGSIKIGLKIRMIFSLTLFSVILGICIYSRARAPLIAIFILVIAFYRMKNKRFTLSPPFLRGIFFRILLVCLLAGIGCYFFYLKEGSSFGRLLMLQIAIRHFFDHFWLGTGLGRFTWYYPNWQSEYFQHLNRPNPDYFLSAGGSYIIFNEFLQLFETVGFLGFIALLLCFIWFFKAKSPENKQVLNACKGTMIGILSCCCFHSPLQVNAILLTLSLCFAISTVARENYLIDPKKVVLTCANGTKYLLLTIFSLICLPALLVCGNQWFYMQKWQGLKEDDLISKEDRERSAEKCYNELRYDGKFLGEYSSFLAQDSLRLGEAIAAAEASRKYFISKESTEDLAFLYFQNKQYGKAIDLFRWLSFYIPNLFRPKLELLELFRKTGDLASARNMARTILSMPIKIPSAEVYAIRTEAELALKEL